jgi:myotubularin-related protein 6/7/8
MQNLSINELVKENVDLSFMAKVVKTDWLGQVGNILTYAQKVSTVISTHASNVLVYCNLGNSGTPLLTSLAQLFLDPYYRTFDGFRVLVHKEWNYYLHNFRKKGLLLVEEKKSKSEIQPQTTQVEGDGIFAQGLFLLGVGNKQNSTTSVQGNVDKKVDPIFILFLDAVAQLVTQNPTAF